MVAINPKDRQYSQTRVNDTKNDLPNLDPAKHITESITVTMQDVLGVPKHLDVSKDCNPEMISQRFLREGADYLVYPYSIIFNVPHPLALNFFPLPWTDTNLSLQFIEKAEKSLPSNAHPYPSWAL